MRQSAWLHAVPEQPAKSRSQRLSRLQQLRVNHKDEAYTPDMPPIDAAAYLLDYLWEVGPLMAAGSGAGPVTHEELRSWQQNTGIELQPWEARFLRRLSYDYLAEARRAESLDCPAPWTPEDASEQDREALSRTVQNALRARMLAQRKTR